MNVYERYNHVYRALDMYNFPTGIPLYKQLQAIRVLYENRALHRDIPTFAEIQTRLQSLATEIYNSANNSYLLHELYDTALELGISLHVPDTRNTQPIHNQANHGYHGYHGYHGLFHEEPYAVDIPKDIYSLEAIVEDSQNVHHTSINEHMKTLVRQLVTDYPPQPFHWVPLKSELTTLGRGWHTSNLETLKFIYENTCTFTIGITLRKIILSVYGFIKDQSSPEIQDQLFRRLNEELVDMRNKCSTGHMSRLINVVQGFSEQYTLNIQPEQEMKGFIYHYLTKQLQEAPESIQDGMMDQTQEFCDFVLSDKHQIYFQQRFGSDHTPFIQKCMREYLSQS